MSDRVVMLIAMSAALFLIAHGIVSDNGWESWFGAYAFLDHLHRLVRP